MLLSLAEAFTLILALFVDGEIKDCVQGGALRVGLVPEIQLNLPSLCCFYCNGKSINLLTENESECLQNTGRYTRLQHRTHYSLTATATESLHRARPGPMRVEYGGEPANSLPSWSSHSTGGVKQRASEQVNT